MIDRPFSGREASVCDAARTAPGVVEYFSLRASAYQARSMRFPWTWVRAREVAAVHSLLGETAGLDILELGAGSGFYARELIRSGARHVWAVDISAAMLAALPTGPITPVLGDAATLRLERRFPILLSTGMLEFVADPAAVLSNASRHAEVGSRFILLAPRANLLGHLYRWFHRSHGVSIHLFDRNWFEATARPAGWRVGAMVPVVPFSLAVRLHRDQ
jgi:SAM-dependent methyltransferase